MIERRILGLNEGQAPAPMSVARWTLHLLEKGGNALNGSLPELLDRIKEVRTHPMHATADHSLSLTSRLVFALPRTARQSLRHPPRTPSFSGAEQSR